MNKSVFLTLQKGYNNKNTCLALILNSLKIGSVHLFSSAISKLTLVLHNDVLFSYELCCICMSDYAIHNVAVAGNSGLRRWEPFYLNCVTLKFEA